MREIDEAVAASLRSIASRVELRSIEVNANTVAWGQYLDERFTTRQWGLFGTSAASQILALCDPADDVYLRYEKLEKARGVLFQDRDQVGPLLKAQQDRGELGNIIRLASVAEALDLDRPDAIPYSAWSPLVKTIVDARDPNCWWSSESASLNGKVPTSGSPFVTAFVVHALRRYEHDRLFDEARRWLVSHLGDPAIKRRLDIVALIGLALLGRETQSSDSEIQDGIVRCQDLILERRGRTRRVTIDRPVFVGYAVDGRTDYAFLNPEMLAALFLMRSAQPLGGRPFVLRVVRETTAHVARGKAFETELGGEAMVEQLWAVRLLHEYRRRAESPELRSTLRPRLFLTLRAVIALIVAVSLLAAGLVLIVADDAGGGTVSIAAGAAIAVVTVWYGERGR